MLKFKPLKWVEGDYVDTPIGTFAIQVSWYELPAEEPRYMVLLNSEMVLDNFKSVEDAKKQTERWLYKAFAKMIELDHDLLGQDRQGS